MPKEPTPRVLRKLMDSAYLFTEDFSVSGLQVYSQTPAGDAVPSSGWEIYTNSLTVQFAVNRQYFDMQGYQDDDISFFPTNPQVQDMNSWEATSIFQFWDFFTVKPIDDAALELFYDATGNKQPPGSSWNNMDLQDIIYARWATCSPSLDTVGLTTFTQTGSYGLNTPTARDRIFITRLVLPAGLPDNQQFFVPPTAFVLAGVSAREKDLVYVERLRRNYDHSSPG